MADEPESLTIRILREIQATQARHTEQLTLLIDASRLHSMQLETHSGMFGEIERILRGMADRRRSEPATAEQLRALEARVEALEGRRT